ncbi:myogenesis-regulating glycosidase-like [Diadema antillarum]|uniref:myogenesis-regulating glycosidase-like n=1 Tax=Diadema antillarum TaxID=105358 RepID=UPI003A839B57
MDRYSINSSAETRVGSTRFLVEEVPEGRNGNGHSMVRLDDEKPPMDDGMTQVELRSRTNSVADPSQVDISQPTQVLRAPREIKLKLMVITLFLLIVTGTTCILLFYSEPPLHYKVGRLTFYVDTKTIRVSFRGRNYTHSRVGLNLPGVTPSTCATTTDQRLCLEWREYGQLEIDWQEKDNMDCYDFAWTAIHKDVTHKDCFSFQNSHWYGGAVVADQQWPLELARNLSAEPFLTGDRDSTFGPIAERYWLSSNGLGVRVNDSSFLFVSVDANSQELCFEAGQTRYSFPRKTQDQALLQYSLCLASDIRAVHRNMSDLYVTRATEPPDSYSVSNPRWNLATPADKSKWNESFLIDAADSLQELGYTAGVLKIPTSYSAHEGDLTFDSSRFGDLSDLMSTVKDLGFKTAIQVTPYCSTQSANFIEGEEKGHWVRDPRNLVPGLTKWENNIGAILDMSSNLAVQWFKLKLQLMKDSGLDAFTFDYGQASYLPVGFQMNEILQNPDEFSMKYTTLANMLASPYVRSAYQSQSIPLMVEMIPKEPNWDYDNGLKTIIPTALTLGLQGYPYFMPDLKVLQDVCTQPRDCLPEKEFLMRYIELSAFFPAMQIPTILSEYDDETKAIVKKWVTFHENTVAPKVTELVADFVQKGDPLVRPLWWVAPMDFHALISDSQFMLGDDLLVAPVLDEGDRQRDVYLPQGSWIDTSDQLHEGNQWLKNVPVPLGDVAYFMRSV